MLIQQLIQNKKNNWVDKQKHPQSTEELVNETFGIGKSNAEDVIKEIVKEELPIA